AESAIDELVVTDTIPLGKQAAQLEKTTVLPVAPLLAEAIRRTHDEGSISSRFIGGSRHGDRGDQHRASHADGEGRDAPAAWRWGGARRALRSEALRNQRRR